MADKKETIFTKLNRVLSGDQPAAIFKVDASQFNNLSPEELQQKTLEAQQGMYLQNQWKKVDSELYSKGVYYEPTRLAAYADFEAMEYFPEISVALDVFGDEATCAGENGKVLSIYSDSPRIKQELETLFEDVLDINTNLPSWARNICKYGENFLFHKILPEKGIVGITQLPNIEITRAEAKFSKSVGSSDDNQGTKFHWANQSLEFNSFEISHFRLMGDDRKLPYGTSILEKCRRIHKQLLMAEDAMLIYRATRAPERRVYKVYVGNMDDKDIDGYVDKIANSFKRTNVTNSQNGNTDTRMNPMSVDQDFFIPIRDPSLPMPIETLPGACISLETRIPLLDGRTLMLSDIIEEWDNGKRNLWAYSCDPKTGEFAPGLITWAGVTRKDAKVLKITLDNGKEITTTPDHKFVHKTKGFVDAENLVVGDSLMPFYTQEKSIRDSKSKYHMIWDNNKNKWLYTHRLVSSTMKNHGLIKTKIHNEELKDTKKETIHHLDLNRYNNNPDNLSFMNNKDHYQLHSEFFGKNFAKMGYDALARKIKENPEFAKYLSDIKSVNAKKFWANLSENELSIIKGKISDGLTNHITNLTEEEKIKRYSKNINSPKSKAITTKKLLEWCKDFENNRSVREKIAITKATPEYKSMCRDLSIERWKIPGYKESVFSKKQTITYTDALYDRFLSVFEKSLRADISLKILNADETFMNEFKSANLDIRSSMTNLDEFTPNHVNKMMKQRGFLHFNDWKLNESKVRGFINMRQWKYFVEKQNKQESEEVSYYNHKITKIEWLTDTQDTGTLTIDGNELYHGYHTFATECGVYIKNSNLDAISDIVYLQNKLLSALRVPKSFLGFEEAMGDGKNLAILDIRFARAVHRVQKALIQELNKIAIIHLYIKGYVEDLNNFTLTLASPSTQADMLKIQNWQTKMSLYRDAVSEAGNGFSAMSMTKAKKDILGMSDDEIKLDINRQVVEKAASEELKILGETIKQTGVFKEIYKVYKINPDNLSTTPSPASDDTGGLGGSGGGGGGMGGMDMGGMGGGVGEDFTDDGSTEELGVDGQPIAAPATEEPETGSPDGGEPVVPAEGGEEDPLNELSIFGQGVKRKENMLSLYDNRVKKLNEDILKTINDIDKINKK